MDFKLLKAQTKYTRNGSSSVNQDPQVEQLKNQYNLAKVRKSSKKHKQIQFELSKGFLVILQSLKLECQGLKFQITQEIKNLKESMLSYFQNQINEIIHFLKKSDDCNKEFENILQNLKQQHQTEIAQLQEHFAIQIEQLQTEVTQTTYKLQQSEDNEIGLMYLNKRQQILNDQLKIKIKRLNEKQFQSDFDIYRSGGKQTSQTSMNNQLNFIKTAQNFNCLQSPQYITVSQSSEKLDRNKSPLHQSLDFGFLQKSIKHKSAMKQEKSKQNEHVNQKMSQTACLFNRLRQSQSNLNKY